MPLVAIAKDVILEIEVKDALHIRGQDLSPGRGLLQTLIQKVYHKFGKRSNVPKTGMFRFQDQDIHQILEACPQKFDLIA